MTKKLVWRLSKLPLPSELVELVKNKIITQEEAKEILLSSEEQADRDKKSLESEIKFLRELVESISQRTQIVEKIRFLGKPYQNWGWHRPYEIWCQTGKTTHQTGTGNITLLSHSGQNFKDINTF